MNDDELVERLERVTYTRERGDGPNGTYFDEPCEADDRDAVASLANPDGPEAASTIRALVADRDAIERRARSFEAGARKLQSRAEAAEAKLRDAVEVLQRAAVRFELLACDDDDTRNGVVPSVGATEIRAFLATMEKPRD